MGAEVWFYHLERTGLETALADLLEKSLQKGWRALVRSPSKERLAQLDQALWAHRDDAFLAHGRADAGDASLQPVLLTTDTDNLNGADCLVLLDRAAPEGCAGFKRTVLIFDGHDTGAVEAARGAWKALKDQGCDLTYWQQGNRGWEKKAESHG